MLKNQELKNLCPERRRRSRGAIYLESVPLMFVYSETPVNIKALGEALQALKREMLLGRAVRSIGK
jgi:hypothetical protein